MVLVSLTRMFSEAKLELVPMSVVAWRRRATMVSDNNLLLPPPYTEISRSANTNITQTLERGERQRPSLISTQSAVRLNLLILTT